MRKPIYLAAIVLACSACSKDDVKNLVTPPDAVSNQSSSQGLGDLTDSSSSNESLDMSSTPAFSSTASQSSNAALPTTSSSAMAPPASASSSSLVHISSSEAAFSSEMTVSSAGASSSVSHGASSEASSEPVTAPLDGAQLFNEQCASCHNLENNLPFQIGANLSFGELHATISNTMPFNNSNHCTGECAMELAYYIENMRL